MAINLTTKFADKVDERFVKRSVTGEYLNTDYDFAGAKKIKVTSVNTVEGTPYDRNAGYGEADTMSNELQELELTRDNKFNIVLDAMDEDESKIRAEEVLARQVKERVAPEVEKYRLAKYVSAVVAENVIESTTSAYADFLDAQTKLDDAEVPEDGRVAYATSAFINKLKKEKQLVETQNNADVIIRSIDSVPVHMMPASYMGAAHCIVTHRSVMVSPIKLQEYKVIPSDANQKYSGTQFMGRYYYDAFILDSKANGFAVIKEGTPS